MAASLTVLDNVAIATPCTVAWDGMLGDDRTRFCTKCNKHVHDISELTTAAAVQLLSLNQQTLCVRLYRRPDGRVVTSDCPKTLRERAWKWLGQRSTWAASLFAMMFMSGCDGIRMGVVSCPRTAKSEDTHYELLPMPREQTWHRCHMSQ